MQMQIIWNTSAGQPREFESPPANVNRGEGVGGKSSSVCHVYVETDAQWIERKQGEVVEPIMTQGTWGYK